MINEIGQRKWNTTLIILSKIPVLFQSTAHFPIEEQKLREEMSFVSEIGEIRSRLAAETAERAQLITALLPAAQDAASYDLYESNYRNKINVIQIENRLCIMSIYMSMLCVSGFTLSGRGRSHKNRNLR